MRLSSRVIRSTGGINDKLYRSAEEARIHREMHDYFEEKKGIPSAYKSDYGIAPLRPKNYGRKGT